MNLIKILERIERYTDIPRLTFEYETNEYIYMADTMNQINYILKNLSLIEGNKQNLKIYKDDPETIKNIKENIKYQEEAIENSLETLEEGYIQHCKYIEKISNYNEHYEEDEL